MVEEQRSGKGRPTPKRREAEALNRRPLVPTDRRAAKRVQRAKYSEQRARMNQAMITGKEDDLPAQHRGPVRRWIRDYIDARWNLGEFFLPISAAIVLILIASSFLGGREELFVTIVLALYVVVLIALVDAVVVAFTIKRKLTAKFGKEKLGRGVALYAVMRAFQMRRTRLPKPQVRRGEYPA